MEESFENMDLENLVIKDKNFYKKRRIKKLMICTPIILVITLVIILTVVLKPKPDNKIICQYQTQRDNETIHLININSDINYNLIIDDINYGKITSYNFNKAGKYNVTFDFKDKLDTVEGFFKGNKNLIEANFSKLQFDNIVSMANLFNSCNNLSKAFFGNKTPILKNVVICFIIVIHLIHFI